MSATFSLAAKHFSTLEFRLSYVETASVSWQKAKIAHFEVSAALFEELGERLVSRPEVALAELIKNSYDADAQTCSVEFEKDRIVVKDDGHGMSESQFLKNWMVVSTQAKGVERYSKLYRRSMAGSKGVGRFSARFLGHALILRSVANDPTVGKKTRLTATFDWRAITREKNIATVEVQYDVELANEEEACGTSLTIYPLRKEAQRISVSQIKTDILRLTDPIAGLEPPPFTHFGNDGIAVDPGFSVLISGINSQDIIGSGPVLLQKEILDSYVGRVRAWVEGEELRYQVYWRGQALPVAEDSVSIREIAGPFTHEALQKLDSSTPVDDRGVPIAVAGVPQLPVAQQLHSPIFIDLRFFPIRSGTFAGLAANGKVARTWVRENASIAIVDNRFAMAAYADEGSDWLGINASKASNDRNWQSIFMPALYPMDPESKWDPAKNPMLALPTGKQLLGRVHIATQKLPGASDGDQDTDDWLQPNMDRESLRNNGAFRLLWHIARFSVELLAHFDRKFRLEEELEAKRLAEVDAKNSLTRAISDIRSSPGISPEYRSRIVEQLEAAQLRFSEAHAYEREARISLELMSMMGVMAGFMTHEFEKAMHTLRSASLTFKQYAYLDKNLKSASDEISALEVALANQMDYMRLFINKARSPKPQNFWVAPQISLVLSNLRSLSEPHSIRILTEIDRKILGPFVPLAAYHGIVVNLLSNAMKALVAKVSSEDRLVLMKAENDANRHILIIADNGIGIPEYLRSRIWDPLFTTTSDDGNPLGSGLGLGLSVVRQVVTGLGGTIELMEEPPKGYVTAFRVMLPLRSS